MAAQRNYQQYEGVIWMDQSGEGARVFDFAAAKRRREISAEPWVKKEKVAEHFDVSTRTVYRWVNSGCPVKRLRGGTLRFQIGPINDWLEQQG